MPKPIEVRRIIKILIAKGFFFVSQTGSHAKYRKHGNPTLNVIVPIHGKEVPHRTVQSILRQSKLEWSEFEKNKK